MRIIGELFDDCFSSARLADDEIRAKFRNAEIDNFIAIDFRCTGIRWRRPKRQFAPRIEGLKAWDAQVRHDDICGISR